MNNKIEDIVAKLNLLSTKSLILFMLSCSERMLPNYFEFYNKYHFGDPSLLRIGLDVVWAWLDLKPNVNINFESLLNKIHGIIPDTEDYPSALCSYALNSSVSIYLTVSSILKIHESLSNAREVATVCTDTVDLFIHESLYSRSEPYLNIIEDELSINQHPLMHRELQRQLLDINFLLNSNIQIAELKNHWSNISVSNIGFSGL